MSARENNGRSMLMLVGAMLIFGTIGVFRKMIPLSSALLACYRGFAGSLFLIVFLRIRRKRFRHNIGMRKVILLIVSGMLIGFNWMLLFEAYNHTTVAVATLCYYMEPTIVVLLSPLFLRERLTLRKGICALVAIIGMGLVSGVADGGLPGTDEILGIALGLGAAALYSAVVLLNKRLPGIDAYEKTIIQLSSAAVVFLPYLLITEDFAGIRLDFTALIMLLVVGFVHTGIAYALYFGSMDGLRGQSVALFSYVDPIAALMLSTLILGERMSAAGIIGAVLILGAAAAGERVGTQSRGGEATKGKQ